MKQTEFARRRRQLMRSMGENSIAIIPAAPVRMRNRDVAYPYRQDSDFHYLSGFGEPDAVLALMPGREDAQYVLFCRERDPEREVWDGPRAGQGGAIESFGADDSFPITDLDDILPGLLEGRERIYYNMGQYEAFDRRMIGWINQIRGNGNNGADTAEQFISLEHLLHEMRLIKSGAELKLMGSAAEVTANAHAAAMKRCRPGVAEYELEAELLQVFKAANGTPAYQSIVGSGSNACVLHYVDNNREVEDGDLVLVDAGVELNCYASDVTRTFPANGRFTREQRAIYDIVLDAQQAAFEALAPGRHWNDFHAAAVDVICAGLIALGLLEGTTRKLIESGAYKQFFMHRTGHWIGMDVHDVGDYKVDDQWRELEPGMVLTVEPGIYIAPAAKGVANKWRGIGVRIEDDVAITKDGYRVLSNKLPRAAMEIEALVQ